MKPPVLSLPEGEAALVRQHYEAAQVILEYGSGGSTWLAAQMPGKFVMSVESDRDWALKLQTTLDTAAPLSPAIVWHSDIGTTGRWGRALDEGAWQKFHRYPLGIWDQPFFRHPDVVLIDGRFRAACLVATAMRITRPVTVLFDDYVPRPAYHVVERLAKPTRIVGRMAEFHLAPGMAPPWASGLLAELCTHVSLAADHVDYSASKPAWAHQTGERGG